MIECVWVLLTNKSYWRLVIEWFLKEYGAILHGQRAGSDALRIDTHGLQI